MSLNRPPLRHVSREFVGFGIAPITDLILNYEFHSVTLVFSERLREKQRLEFPFTWPRSLVGADGSCRVGVAVTRAPTALPFLSRRPCAFAGRTHLPESEMIEGFQGRNSPFHNHLFSEHLNRQFAIV